MSEQTRALNQAMGAIPISRQGNILSNIADLNQQVADRGGVDKIYGTEKENKTSMLGDLSSGQVGAIGQGIGGLASIASSIVGGRARRQEQAQARDAYRNRMSSFEQMNYYGSQPINPFANLTVNQLQAQFQARQQQQMAANTMAQLRGAAGGSGIARFSSNIITAATRQPSTNSWWYRSARSYKPNKYSSG